MRRENRVHRLCPAILPVALALLASSASAQPYADLQARIEELERQLQALKQQLQTDKAAAAETAKAAPVVTLGADGFYARSANTNFIFRFRATVQGDARFYPGGTANDTFLIRRLRPIFEGTVFERFDYRLMLDFGSGLTSTPGNIDFVQEGFINARLWPEFQIQAGKMKAPVGLERLVADTDLVFMERQYPTQLVPNRDVGIQLQGEIGGGVLAYQAGVFNGVADGGSGDFETDDGDKDFAGRLFARPFATSDVEALRGFGLGVAGTVGRQKGTLRSFVTPGQQRFFAYRVGAGTNAATANVTAEGEHWRLVPQAYYYWGRFGLLGEYALSDQRVGRAAGGAGTFANIDNRAWQVTASCFLTPDRNRFADISPTQPVSFTGAGGWGAWELVAQVGQLELDPSLFPLYANPATSARRATSWGVGLNWYPNRNLKLMLNYERTDFRGGQSSSLTAKGEDAILTRIQLAF
jgi:phosphate-selective porin OprO and OprP